MTDRLTPDADANLCQRLRQYEGKHWETTVCYNGTRDEAADRIEAQAREIGKMEGEINYQIDRANKAERERDALKARAERAKAENARLREALLDLRERYVDLFNFRERPSYRIGSDPDVDLRIILATCDAALAPVEAKFTPHKGCKTFDTCRKAEFCMDAWHCSAQAKGGDHGR
jgi:hypothetical protein